jgi:TPR repeat protein
VSAQGVTCCAEWRNKKIKPTFVVSLIFFCLARQSTGYVSLRRATVVSRLKEAAYCGSANAQKYLAGCYETKKKENISLYLLASDQNHPSAIYFLAAEYEKGFYFQNNEDEAFKLYAQSASLGCDQATNKLQDPKWRSKF